MEIDSSGSSEERPHAADALQSRALTLQARVNAAAKALHERGIRPTVARVRAALGGGSPNELAPAVKHWREGVLPVLPAIAGSGSRTPPLPLQLTDLVYELWQRAMGAALVEVRGGATAREVVARTAEAQGLRQQVVALRDRLQRESLAYGELRAQAARHETIAREALARAHEGEERERELLRELGGLRQRVAELGAVGERRGVRRLASAMMGRAVAGKATLGKKKSGKKKSGKKKQGLRVARQREHVARVRLEVDGRRNIASAGRSKVRKSSRRFFRKRTRR